MSATNPIQGDATPRHEDAVLPANPATDRQPDVATSPPPAPACTRPTQMWTTSGYPVVDGKYLDLSDGQLKAVTPGDFYQFGPPAVDVYWHNQRAPADDEPRPFIAVRYPYMGSVTEYLVKVARFFARGGCEVESMSVSRYAVQLVVRTEMTRDEVRDGVHKALYGPTGAEG